MPSHASIRIFYSYSHKDEQFREHLEEHLAILQRAGLVESWSDRKIVPGQDWKAAIDENLERADLILILVSSSFIASDYCYEKELGVAMSRHESGAARVIPIFVRPAEWRDAPFASLQGLPKDGEAISLWENQDVAWQSIASSLRAALQEIREQKERPSSVGRMKTLQEALTEDVERIDGLYGADNHHHTEGLSTGFSDLDRVTNGLQKGELFVIASRPAMGKTSLALNIISAVAGTGLPVLIFSTKLPAVDISRRLITLKGLINYSRMGTGSMPDSDWPKLASVITALSDMTVLIDDSPSISLSEVRERCLREKKKAGALSLIVIDSLEYLTVDEESVRQRQSTGQFLKVLARELDTTIIVSCVVSRVVEQRPNKRPVLRDVDSSSGLVDEADVITFLYMDSHYNIDSPDFGTAELIVAKNQFGPLGAIRLSHLPLYGAFQPYS